SSVPVLLEVVEKSAVGPVRQEALAALAYHGDEKIAKAVLSLYPDKLPAADGVRAAALDLLGGRASSSLLLLNAIDEKKTAPRPTPADVVQKMQLHSDKEVAKLLAKHYGRVRAASAQEKQKEMLRIGNILKAGKGDAKAGAVVYKDT